MTWTHIGTDDYRGSGTTSGQTAWTVAAGTIGDLRVIEFLTISSTISVSALSGGGVTTWQRAGSVNSVSASSIGVAAKAEVWYGRITSTGTALTLTYSATIGSVSCRALRRDFRSARTSTLGFAVAANGFSQTNNITTASPLTWPSLTTTKSDQLVVGCMGDSGATGYAGASTGYTYTTDADANWHQYRLVTAAAEVEAATMTFTGSDGWYVMQTIFDDGVTPATDADVAAVANQPTASIGGNAGNSVAAAVANNAQAGFGANATDADVVATANNAGITITAIATDADVVATANNAVASSGVNASSGSASAVAYDATVTTGTLATGATESASAFNAQVAIVVNAGLAIVSATGCDTYRPTLQRTVQIVADQRTTTVADSSRTSVVQQDRRTVYTTT